MCSGCLKKNDLALVPQLSNDKSSDREIEEEEEEEIEDEEEEEERESPRRNREDSKKTGPICEAYMKRECPHGLTGKRKINGEACPHRHLP